MMLARSYGDPRRFARAADRLLAELEVPQAPTVARPRKATRVR